MTEDKMPEQVVTPDVATMLLELLGQVKLAASDPDLAAKTELVIKARDQLAALVG